MRYLSLDLETTGLDPDNCQVLQIGAVVEDTGVDPLPAVEELPAFEALINHKGAVLHGQLPAFAMNAELLKRIVDEHIDEPIFAEENLAWDELVSFAEEHLGRDRWVIAGKNVAGFDLRFAPGFFLERCHHRSIDAGSVALGAEPSFWNRGAVPALVDLIQLEKGHDAVADARDVVRCLRALTENYRGSGL
jgi:oligoribonuclease